MFKSIGVGLYFGLFVFLVVAIIPQLSNLSKLVVALLALLKCVLCETFLTSIPEEPIFAKLSSLLLVRIKGDC